MSSIKDLDLTGDNSIYLRFASGTTRFRIVSKIIPIWTEFLREEKKAVKYMSEELAKDHPDAKLRHAFWCLDRTDNKFKVAECGVSIMRQIQTLALDPDYSVDSDIFPYDTKVLREGESMQDTNYTVTPSPATDLTDDEKAKIVGLEDITTFFSRQPGVVTTKPDPSVAPF
jgi:hypothetical protein